MAVLTAKMAEKHDKMAEKTDKMSCRLNGQM